MPPLAVSPPVPKVVPPPGMGSMPGTPPLDGPPPVVTEPPPEGPVSASSPLQPATNRVAMTGRSEAVMEMTRLLIVWLSLGGSRRTKLMERSCRTHGASFAALRGSRRFPFPEGDVLITVRLEFRVPRKCPPALSAAARLASSSQRVARVTASWELVPAEKPHAGRRSTPRVPVVVQCDILSSRERGRGAVPRSAPGSRRVIAGPALGTRRARVAPRLPQGGATMKTQGEHAALSELATTLASEIA